MKSIWDFWANKYERLWVQKYSLGPTRVAILRKVEKISKRKKLSLLDMGCGTGQLLRELKEKNNNINSLVGVDYSRDMIQVAKSKDNDIKFINQSIFDFREVNKFDVITCSHSFPYYEDKKRAIDIFSNALSQEGILLLAQASENSLYDKICMIFVKFTTTKAKYLSKLEIINLVKDKFTIEDITYIKEKWYMPSIILFELKKV